MSTVTTIAFEVLGSPVPQGSMRAFVVRGRPIVTSANKSLSDWRNLVASVAQRHAPPAPSTQAVNLTLQFKLQRPKSLSKHITDCVKRPDLDKCVRAILDALTGIMYEDDSQVNAIRAFKYYGSPGVQITLTWTEPEISIEKEKP